MLGLTFVILTRDLIGFTELVLNRGVGGLEVARLAFYKAVPVTATILPFAVLIGSLVALGRLGADREVLVLEASGITAARLTGPIALLASLLTLGSAGLSLWGAPGAQRALDAQLDRIARNQPWTQIRSGEVNRFGGWQLQARAVTSKGDELRGVLLWMPDLGETIFARRGRVGTGEDGIELRLEQGRLILSPEQGAQELRFESLTTELPESDEPLARDPEARLQGRSLAALADAALEAGDAGAASVTGAVREWHRRFATPVATLLFGFLAAPLFLTRSHFSRAGGTVLGVLTMIGYFALAQLGEGLAQAGTLGTAGGVWLPNAVLVVLALLLYGLARREGVLRRSLDRPQVRESRLQALPGRRPDKTHRRALPRYVATRFLELAGVSFAVLLAAYLLVDVMERLDWFARYRASGDEVLRFYLARVPLLASRVVPMALLIGAALITSLLAVEGELIGMRACGIPSAKALLPVLLLSVVATPLYFALRDVVVPRTNALADELKQTEIKDVYYRELRESRKTAVWHRSGRRLLEAARFDMKRGDAQELTIYDLDENGLPVSRADARSARHIGRGVWRLVEPTRVEVTGSGVRRVPARAYADLGKDLTAQLDTMHLSTRALAREIEQVEADGYDATSLRVDYHVKLADAFACIVLPASVLFFAITGPPFPGPAQTLVASGLLAVVYVLLMGVGSSLGYSGALPAPLAGWAPTAALAALAGFLASRVVRQL